MTYPPCRASGGQLWPAASSCRRRLAFESDTHSILYRNDERMACVSCRDFGRHRVSVVVWPLRGVVRTARVLCTFISSKAKTVDQVTDPSTRPKVTRTSGIYTDARPDPTRDPYTHARDRPPARPPTWSGTST